jgi:hypothetical protein
MANLASIPGLREPEASIWSCRNTRSYPIARQKREFSDDSGGGDATNRALSKFGEPNITIRPGGDAGREGVCIGKWKFSDAPSRSNTRYLASCATFREPEIPIGASHYAPRTAPHREWKFRDDSGGCDTPDLVQAFREPKTAIWSGRDANCEGACYGK